MSWQPDWSEMSRWDYDQKVREIIEEGAAAEKAHGVLGPFTMQLMVTRSMGCQPRKPDCGESEPAEKPMSEPPDFNQITREQFNRMLLVVLEQQALVERLQGVLGPATQRLKELRDRINELNHKPTKPGDQS